MTSFEIARVGFTPDAVGAWALLDRRNVNWPVVYILDSASPQVKSDSLSDVYVVVSITPEDGHLHVVVDFTGTFPGGQIGGIFDMKFSGDKITFIRADLL